MKKAAIMCVCLLAIFGWSNLSVAGCDNGMLLPQGAKVSRTGLDKSGNVTVTITGVKVKMFYHYNFEKPVPVVAQGDSFTYNAYEGAGFNFTFEHSKCTSAPYSLITPEMMSEAKAMGRKPYFIGDGIGVDCNRPDGSCAYIVVVH